MAKDSYWFRHDSTAGRGSKLRKIQHIYGHWGKGIYWDVIETLREQNNYTYESDTSSLQMLADIIGCKDETKFITWYKDAIKYELFEEKNGLFYSPILLEHMEVWETKKRNGSKGGRGKKANQKLNESELIADEKHKITEENNTLQNIDYKDYKELIVVVEGDEIWMENMQRIHKKTKEEITEFLRFFSAHLISIESPQKTMRDFKQHFNNWLRKQANGKPTTKEERIIEALKNF